MICFFINLTRSSAHRTNVASIYQVANIVHPHDCFPLRLSLCIPFTRCSNGVIAVKPSEKAGNFLFLKLKLWNSSFHSIFSGYMVGKLQEHHKGITNYRSQTTSSTQEANHSLTRGIGKPGWNLTFISWCQRVTIPKWKGNFQTTSETLSRILIHSQNKLGELSTCRVKQNRTE